MSIFSRAFRRSVAALPSASSAGAEEVSVMTLDALPRHECPSADAGDLLPCEKPFLNAALPEGVDADFLHSLAKDLGYIPKYIPIESLRATKAGDAGLRFPAFAFIDPFLAHPANDPSLTCATVLTAWNRTIGSSRGGWLGQGFTPTPGILMVYPPYHGDRYVIISSVGRQEFSYPAGTTGPSLQNDVFGARGYYTNVPGQIPPAHRQTILSMQAIAKKHDADVRLIVEANWLEVKADKLAALAKDPLIVIVKGETIAYIDRFDCTAREENLAREHAVKVPGL